MLLSYNHLDEMIWWLRMIGCADGVQYCVNDSLKCINHRLGMSICYQIMNE